MAEMAAAARTEDLGADHAVAEITLLMDMVLDGRTAEARPAASGVELGIGFKQRLPATGTDISARPVLMLALAGKRPLGRLLAQHRVLHGCQFFAPLGFALDELA